MPPTSPADDLTGREIGGYGVLRKLGAGGMAEVYLAEQRSLARQVALKVLHQPLSRDGAFVERFKREARAAAALIHANIVQIYEVGQASGVHFIAQEYVRGRNLAEVLRREASLPAGSVLDVLRQVTSALAKAAELGIVHRDIKPENILLSESGEVKVADFGLARIESADAQTLTQAGVTMGTPLYMSPEQIEGRPVDSRSDIYSLGVTAYHLLAGVPPHTGETALAIAVHHLNTPPQPLENLRPDVPQGLARIVHRMIAKRPEHRYRDPQELLGELRRLAAEAAAQGWGSAGDWPDALASIAAGESSRGVAELARLMQAAARLETPRWFRGRTAAILAGAILVGALVGVITRPAFLLKEVPTADVPKQASEWSQLFQANLAPSEQAWLAVERHFPDADPLVKELARQGLVRYRLFNSEDFAQALELLDAWPPTGLSGEALASSEAFRRASECIANERLGRRREARAAAAALTDDMRQLLRETEPRLYERFSASQGRLDAEL
jgi:serine/threonine-protein kinase